MVLAVLKLVGWKALVLGAGGGAALQAGLLCPVPSSSLPGTSFYGAWSFFGTLAGLRCLVLAM